MLRILAKRIASSLSAYTIGENLFIGSRPDDAPANCICITQRVQGLIDDFVPQHRTKRFQIVVRHTNDRSAQDTCKNVVDLFVYPGTDWEGEEVGFVGADEAHFLEQDDSGRYEYTTNLTIRSREKGDTLWPEGDTELFWPSSAVT